MGVLLDLFTRNIALTISIGCILASLIFYLIQIPLKNSRTIPRILLLSSLAFYGINSIAFRLEDDLPKDGFSLEHEDPRATTQEIAIVIHGFPFGVIRQELREDAGLLKQLILMRRYQKIYVYRYFLGQSIRARAEKLRGYLKANGLLQTAESPRLAFYGFSIGGLIVRDALQTSEEVDASTHYLIMIGTPNNGVFRPWVRYVLKLVGAYPEAVEATEGSAFLRRLNSQEGGMQKALAKSYVILSDLFDQSDTLVKSHSATCNESFRYKIANRLSERELVAREPHLFSHGNLPSHVSKNGVGVAIRQILKEIDQKK